MMVIIMRAYIVSITMMLVILTTWIFGYIPVIQAMLLDSAFLLITLIDLKYNKEVNKNVEKS